MEFPCKKEISEFVDKIYMYLNDSEKQTLVNYPKDKTTPWNSEALLQANNDLLNAVSGKANVYAIFCADSGSDRYILRYIGKTTRKLARQRIMNHLIKKHEKTGAKLSKVIDHVQAGGKIKISWVEIYPESMRNCVEEELIHKNPDSNWNRENA